MSASEFIKSIHALAVLRHLDYDASQIGVVVKPLSGALYSGCKLTPPDLSRDVELSEACAWEAQVRLKGGDWGCFVGTGQTPDEALLSLLRSYEASHEAVDKRRAGVLERRKVAMATCERAYVAVKDTGATPPEKCYAEFVAPSKPHRALSAEERAGLRIGQGDLLDELMEQAQHHDSGGQTWEMLKTKRRELGLPDFVLANERAPTK